ncbi:MAG: hypothetical protein J6U85_01370 [Bacteroidales bacterium]|nr:hypothetical protein [Bacteroidales bacterium]
MKRLIITLFICLFSASGIVNAQVNQSRWANEWRYAFSKEGMKEWRPEFTLKRSGGFFTDRRMLTGGVRVDEKRSFALYLGQGNQWIDHAPAHVFSIRTGVSFRRYWHLGARKTFAFYNDLSVGIGWVYKIDGGYHETPDGEIYSISEEIGDMLFEVLWQPGFRVRFYKNIHMFFGPTLATDCIGIHFGVGF